MPKNKVKSPRATEGGKTYTAKGTAKQVGSRRGASDGRAVAKAKDSRATSTLNPYAGAKGKFSKMASKSYGKAFGKANRKASK